MPINSEPLGAVGATAPMDLNYYGLSMGSVVYTSTLWRGCYWNGRMDGVRGDTMGTTGTARTPLPPSVLLISSTTRNENL